MIEVLSGIAAGASPIFFLVAAWLFVELQNARSDNRGLIEDLRAYRDSLMRCQKKAMARAEQKAIELCHEFQNVDDFGRDE